MMPARSPNPWAVNVYKEPGQDCLEAKMFMQRAVNKIPMVASK